MTTYEQLESRESELIAIINGDPTEEQYHRAMRELAGVQSSMMDEWMKKMRRMNRKPQEGQQ